MSHPSDRFVAHFDMLGMRSLTKRNPDLAWKCLSDLSRARDERMHMGIELVDSGELIANQVHSFIFSDTLISFSKGNAKNDALALLLLTTELFTLALHYCIPLRGGIAYGRFDFNLERNLFSGPALVDAYELGEASQWLGVVLDDWTADIAKRIPLRSQLGIDGVVPWDVPQRNGPPATRNVMNWIQPHKYCGPVPLEAEVFYAPMAKMFGPWRDLPSSVRLKYESTVAFFNVQYVIAAKILPPNRGVQPTPASGRG